MIEPGLASRLIAQVPSAGGRVYPKILPQNVAYPALTYEVVSDPRIYAQDGPQGLVAARYQVTAWSTSYAAMKGVQNEVRSALEGFAGPMNGHHVASIFHAGSRDLFDPGGNEVGQSKAGVHYGPADYMISYQEN